jgi:hypothetical protein
MATEEEILKADYSSRTLFISTPMFGGNCSGLFHQSVLGLQKMCLQLGLHAAISDQWQEALITRARNVEVDKFRASGMSHHVFIDADQGFRPNDVLQMLLADKDVVCAPVAKKAINWLRITEAVKRGFPSVSLENFAPDLNLNTVEKIKFDGQPQQVREGGTGLFMVKRHVYDKMQEAYPEIEYLPMDDEAAEYGDRKYFYCFYDAYIDPETRHYLSEDWGFCRRWRLIGGEVYILPWLVTAHIGTYVYVANAPALAALQSGEAPVIVDAEGKPVAA